jgi:hypothetical protein
MTLASNQAAISHRPLLLIPVAVAAGMVLLVRAARSGSGRNFMVLLILGGSIGFIFLVMMQMPEFPQWLGVTLLLIVFIPSFFGVRIFLRSAALEETDQDDKIRAEDAHDALDRKFPDMKPTNHTL